MKKKALFTFLGIAVVIFLTGTIFLFLSRSTAIYSEPEISIFDSTDSEKSTDELLEQDARKRDTEEKSNTLELFDNEIGRLTDVDLPAPDGNWSPKLERIAIPSTYDGKVQEAHFVSSSEKAPLIVSLHQWRSNYNAFDPMSNLAIEHNWNYIRPNFRGPNTRPEAGGSEQVIQDIDDAISLAVNEGNVDIDEIYVIGASGGGHAALMHLMNSELPVDRYSVWVPITDLIAWFGESRVRQRTYHEDILAITESVDGNLNIEEARKRSPMYQEAPLERLQQTDIHIFAGVHDGYEGAVPISHSINFYNKLIDDLGYPEDKKVPYEVEAQLLYTQQVYDEAHQHEAALGERSIIFETTTQNTALTIFDGDHELLHESAFGLFNEPFNEN